MKIGRMNERITFQKNEIVSDQYKNRVPVWSDYFSCIEQYARAKNMSTEDVVSLFEKYGITEHFCEFFEVLHTHGHNWLIEEIDEMINKRKK